MDDIDRRLLALLQHDSSRPLKSLAAEVALSRSAVRERIARLVAGGIIRRYTVELAAPPRAVTAYLSVRLARTPSPQTVARIAALPEVARLSSLSGPVDLLVEVVAPDVGEINRVRDLVAADPFVADVETAFVLKLEKAAP